MPSTYPHDTTKTNHWIEEPGDPCICKDNPEVAKVIQASRAPICPECRSGKHRNCDGSALDEAADDIVECRCPPAFHPEKRS